MTPTRTLLFLLLLAGTALTGCRPSTVFDQSSPLPEQGWAAGDTIHFQAAMQDTLNLHEMYLTVRHTTGYPYRNLFLFLDIAFPDGRILRDTLECMLAEPSGRWTGKGFGHIKSHAFLFRDDVWFPAEGPYGFSLVHGMREDTLEGMADIGIRIERK
jgi:gliding motility-associated lipoprotein GldH